MQTCLRSVVLVDVTTIEPDLETNSRLRSLHRLGRRGRAKTLILGSDKGSRLGHETRYNRTLFMLSSFSICRHRDANIIVVRSDDLNGRRRAERGEARYTISSSADDRLKRARRSFYGRARHIVIRFSTGGDRVDK